MSTLLEQAIVDAAALKEAALKSAEKSILDKYAPEVRNAVTSLLEQEEDMGMGGMDEEDDDESIPLGAEEGEKLCPCPDDDEVIEVDLVSISDLADKLDSGTPEDIADQVTDAAAEEGGDDMFELTEEMVDSILEEGEIDERIKTRKSGFVVRYDSDSGEYTVGREDASEDELYFTDDLEDALATLEVMIEHDKMTTASAMPIDAAIRAGLMDEEIEITEENLDSIMEELIVDISPEKSGWAGTPTSTMNYYAELELARLASTEAQEEIETMNKALSNIKKDYAQLSESFDSVNGRNKKLAQTVTSLKEKLEEVNLTNARLFYTNRVLNSDSLNERQKTKIVEAISESRSVNEAKIVFETLRNAVGSSPVRKAPKSLSEAVNRSSTLMARRESSSSADTSAVERLQRLAGITKNI